MANRTKKWEKVRAELNKELLKIGLTWCEAGYADCMRGIGLGHAHTRKRRNITTEEQWRETALVCTSCHQKLELLPESEMGEKIREMRAKRGMD